MSKPVKFTAEQHADFSALLESVEYVQSEPGWENDLPEDEDPDADEEQDPTMAELADLRDRMDEIEYSSPEFRALVEQSRAIVAKMTPTEEDEREELEAVLAKLDDFLAVDWEAVVDKIEDDDEVTEAPEEWLVAGGQVCEHGYSYGTDTATSMVASGLPAGCLPCQQRANNRPRPKGQQAPSEELATLEETHPPVVPVGEARDISDDYGADPETGEVYWHGVIGLEGVATGDNRFIENDALTWASFPLPLRYVSMDVGAHDGAQVVGNITDGARGEGGKILGWGTFDVADETGRTAARKVFKKINNGISMDLDEVVIEVKTVNVGKPPKTVITDEGEMTVQEEQVAREVTATTEARIRAATIVAIPAFADARIQIISKAEYDQRPGAQPQVLTAEQSDDDGDGSEIDELSGIIDYFANDEYEIGEDDECWECLEQADDAYNWVEEVGGLPPFIKRIASHLQRKGMTEGHAIATAVNVVKKMCATGDLNYPGKQTANPVSRAKACAAVASWEAKKIRARANAGATLEFAEVERVEPDASVLCISGECENVATHCVPSSEGDFYLMLCDECARRAESPEFAEAARVGHNRFAKYIDPSVTLAVETTPPAPLVKEPAMAKPQITGLKYSTSTTSKPVMNGQMTRTSTPKLASRMSRRKRVITFAFNPDQWRDPRNGRWIDMPWSSLGKLRALFEGFDAKGMELMFPREAVHAVRSADARAQSLREIPMDDPSFLSGLDFISTRLMDADHVFEQLGSRNADPEIAESREALGRVWEDVEALAGLTFSGELDPNAERIDNDFEEPDTSMIDEEADDPTDEEIIEIQGEAQRRVDDGESLDDIRVWLLESGIPGPEVDDFISLLNPPAGDWDDSDSGLSPAEIRQQIAEAQKSADVWQGGDSEVASKRTEANRKVQEAKIKALTELLPEGEPKTLRELQKKVAADPAPSEEDIREVLTYLNSDGYMSPDELKLMTQLEQRLAEARGFDPLESVDKGGGLRVTDLGNGWTLFEDDPKATWGGTRILRDETGRVVLKQDPTSAWLNREQMLQLIGRTILKDDLVTPRLERNSSRGRRYSTEETETLTAASPPVKPPKAWFANPNLTEVTPLKVDDDGRIYGHLAEWNTCHTGHAHQCIVAPKTKTDYAYFHLGAVQTAEGDEVAVGHITLDTGHAGPKLDVQATLAHYDNTGRTVADVRVGEDRFGIWVSGALRPDVTDRHVRALRSSPLSGDWRAVKGNLELVAALAVNVPGFPIPRPKGLVASGHIRSLVASGMVAPRRIPAPGSPEALSPEDVKYLKQLAARERRTHVDELAAKVREAKLAANRKKIDSMASSLRKMKGK